MRLTISRALIEEMRAIAGASPNLEVCGLLLGPGDIVENLYPCDNVATDPADSFEIDPRALIAAHRAARNGGPSVLGHYHSHPRGPARPSLRDAAAAEPGSLWVILGDRDIGCWLAIREPSGSVGFEPVAFLTVD